MAEAGAPPSATGGAKGSRRKYRRLTTHLKRVSGKLQLLDSEGKAGSEFVIHVVLHDVSLRGVGFFSPKNINTNQKVRVLVSEPLPLDLKGTVVWSQEFTHSMPVMMKDSFNFRIGVEFEIATDLEKKQISDLCGLLQKLKLGPS